EQSSTEESHLSSEEEAGEPSVVIGLVLLRLQHAVVLWFSRARRRLLQGFTVFSTVLLLLWIATFLYGTFYYSYMPKAAFSAPVYYYYRTNCESPSSFWCSYPVANVSLMRNGKHALTFGQVYRMYLQLEMPDSPTNHEVGMFMIKTTCFSQDGGQVASSARTGMLRYRSDLLNTLGTLLLLPAFLSGAAEQKQVVQVELFSEFTDDPYAPSVMAAIEILSSKVQIYSSHLFVHAHFTGLRYLLFYYPVLSALIGVATNFTFLSFLFILSYMRQLRLPQKPEQVRGNFKPDRMEGIKMEDADSCTGLSDETRQHLSISDGPSSSCTKARGKFRPRLLATKSFPPYSQCIGGLGEDEDWDSYLDSDSPLAYQSNAKKEKPVAYEADDTAKYSRDILRAKWKSRRKEKLGGSLDVGTDGCDRGRLSGKRRVENSGIQGEHCDEDEGKHRRGKSSSLKRGGSSVEKEDGKPSPILPSAHSATHENSSSVEDPEGQNREDDEVTEPSGHRHPILSKLLHSSTSSSCSSINLSSDSDEVFSDLDDAVSKRKTFKKVRTPHSANTNSHFSAHF
uniref:Seipin n=1 Tax=Xiphophorus couchianus TaxID=32473 RepID=A0A3B5KWG4_9TELE